MPPVRHLFSPTATRLLMALLVLGFLLVHGVAGPARQLLGSVHRHDGGHPVVVAPAPASVATAVVAASGLRAQLDGWLSTLRAWRLDRHAHHHAAGLSDPGHRHGAFERHHHDIGDASVVALDDGGAAGHQGAEGLSTASTLGAEWPPGLAHAPATVATAATVTASAWPGAPGRTWRNALVRLPERPPRA